MNRTIIILIIFSVIIFFTLKKVLKGDKVLKGTDTINDVQDALRKVSAAYGVQIARNVERIYRLETANFTSEQFKKTFSAGMEAFKDEFPYGWYIGGFWNQEEGFKYKPIGTAIFREGKGLLGNGKEYKKFIKFPNVESAIFTLAEFLYIYKNNAGRWFSTDPNLQSVYNFRIDQINTLFT